MSKQDQIDELERTVVNQRSLIDKLRAELDLKAEPLDLVKDILSDLEAECQSLIAAKIKATAKKIAASLGLSG